MLELRNITFDVPVQENAKETKRIIDDLSITAAARKVADALR